MTQQFDQAYWESHWGQADGHGTGPPSPYLAREVGNLTPGTALDAGCGEGAEAIWLAAKGWQVTAADISTEALSRAAAHAATSGTAPAQIRWVEADLSFWEPGTRFDLVTTHYAHAAIAQLALYERISHWVAPGGTLLIVGHRHSAETAGHGHHPPEKASVTAGDITAALGAGGWDIVTVEEPTRTLTSGDGRTVQLDDVIVRATRGASSSPG
jgi:SAM-dependent methyltransferase